MTCSYCVFLQISSAAWTLWSWPGLAMNSSKVQGFSGFWVMRFPCTDKLEPLGNKTTVEEHGGAKLDISKVYNYKHTETHETCQCENMWKQELEHMRDVWILSWSHECWGFFWTMAPAIGWRSLAAPEGKVTVRICLLFLEALLLCTLILYLEKVCRFFKIQSLCTCGMCTWKVLPIFKNVTSLSDTCGQNPAPWALLWSDWTFLDACLCCSIVIS